MDRAYYEEIAGHLHGLLIRLDDWLPSKDVTLIAEFMDANELGLPLEQMADVLSEDEQPVSADERADMLALVDRMQMDDRVSRSLAFCPARWGEGHHRARTAAEADALYLSLERARRIQVVGNLITRVVHRLTH